ncbi:MAG: magnesium/cobalt transporter CorA [Sphaerochaeta sp.]|jgi:magnesium transporter
MAERRINHYIHKKKEGLAPGSLLYGGIVEAERTTIVTHQYAKGSYQRTDGYHEPKDPSLIRYVEICGLEDLDAITTVAKHFSISNLSLEDAFSTNQRLKLDEYDSYLAVTMRITEEQDQQITLFLGEGWVISIAERKSPIFDPLFERLAAPTKLQAGSAGMLVHSIIDLVVDQYLLQADELELATEELERVVITQPQSSSASTIHHHKAEVLRLRRMTGPLREIIASLIRSESSLLDHNTRYLLKDVQDHALWLAEELEMLRETVSGIMEIYLSSLDIKMNAIMKVLTIISTIFIPLTFLTGLYGMNFVHIPFSSIWWGFYAILGASAILSVVLALYFRKKQWW